MNKFLILSLALATPFLSSCSSLNAIKRGDLSGVITAPFELADNILETTVVLEGKEPSWSKKLPKTYTDATNGTKTVFPRGYNYGTVSWSGAKDTKGFATGPGTLKTYSPSRAYAFTETGTMQAGRWVGATKETDKEGKEWKCVWFDGMQSSRERIYTSAELEQQRLASRRSAERQRVALAKFSNWLGNAMAGSSSSGSSSSSSSTGSSSSGSRSGDYEDCICTYDARKGESKSSGYNTIRIRSSRGSWSVTYYFGDTGYVMSGSGNLEGRSINVRFDNGRPASLKCYAGSGYCKVTSASRN